MVIDDFHGKNFFLSNFYAHPFYYDGHEWKTVEHAFQATKCADKNDYIAVMNAKTPGEAKRIGRRANIVDDWDNIRYEVMHDCLLMKFLGNDDLLQKLLDTGDATLIEGNTWHDNFWGSCSCEKCGNRGYNTLGNMLMEIRYNYRYGNYCWVAIDRFSDDNKICEVFKSRDSAMDFIASQKADKVNPFEAGSYRIKPFLLR